MNKSKYSMNAVYQVWNDETGDRIEIGPDSDGLDMIEMRLPSGPQGQRTTTDAVITMTREQAELVITALKQMLLTPVGDI